MVIFHCHVCFFGEGGVPVSNLWNLPRILMFPTIGIPQNRWFIRENPKTLLKWDDLGVPTYFWKHPYEALNILSLVKYLQPSGGPTAGWSPERWCKQATKGEVSYLGQMALNQSSFFEFKVQLLHPRKTNMSPKKGPFQ